MSRASDPRPQSSGAALLIQSREQVVVSARWLMAALLLWWRKRRTVFCCCSEITLFVFIVLFNRYGQFVSLLHFLNSWCVLAAAARWLAREDRADLTLFCFLPRSVRLPWFCCSLNTSRPQCSAEGHTQACCPTHNTPDHNGCPWERSALGLEDPRCSGYAWPSPVNSSLSTRHMPAGSPPCTGSTGPGFDFHTSYPESISCPTL